MTDDEKDRYNEKEDRVRDAISNDYDNNLLIEALAGAGKTTILVERMVNQAKTMDIVKIVAITFTEKAADELKARFQKRLLQVYDDVLSGKEDNISQEEEENLKKAVENINDIQISTIHSFCNKMLQEMTFEANLGLDFEIVQDIEEEASVRTFFENFCRNDERKDNRKKLEDIGINAEQLFSTFREMCNKYNVDEWDYEKELASDNVKNIIEELKGYNILPDIAACMTGEKNDGFEGFTEKEILDGGCEGYLPVILELGQKIFKYVKNNNDNLDINGIKLLQSIKVENNSIKGICYGSKPRNTDEKDYGDGYIKRSRILNGKLKELDGTTDRLNNINTRWNNYCHAVCMEFLVNAYVEYHNKKNYGGRVSNNDLLILTKEMLGRSKIARDYFRNKYQYFYIDEYQDTDPLQTDILKLLTANEESLEKNNELENIELENIEFENGRFCLIGDPKQSIYAFRGADVRLYAKMRAIIQEKKNCKLYQMNRNYRSNNELCEWINKKFKKDNNDAFGFDTCENAVKDNGTQAGFDYMLSAKETGNTCRYIKGVYKYTIDIKDNKKDVIIESDAKHVAAMINNMIKNKVMLSIDDTNNKVTERAVEAGDFMIITRNKHGIKSYSTELKSLGIPVLVNGASAFSADEESNLASINNLIMLSDFIADKNYRERKYRLCLILMKVYRIKISPVQLFTYCNTIFGDDSDEKIEEISDERLKNILSVLKDFIKKSKSNPLRTFENLTQYYTALLSDKLSYENLKTEVSAIEQLLEKVKETTYGTYKELNEHIKLILSEKNEKEMSLSESESKKAVHIMNVHLAKGLESNIVILANPSKQNNTFKDNILINEQKDKGNRVGYVNVTLDSLYSSSNQYYGRKTYKNKNFECEKKEPERLCDEENLRVLYVAGTRAKECLIIADSTKPGNNAWSDLSCDIHDIDANNDDTPEYQKMIEMGEKYSSNDSGEKEHLVDINEKISQYNHLKEEKDKIIKELESVAQITIKPSEQEKHISTDTVDSNYMRGNMYGTMMHKFFELAVKEVWKGILKHKSGVIQLDQIEISDEDIKAMIRKSVAAGHESESLTSGQCKRLKIKDNIEQILSKTLIEQEEILTKHLFKEFEKIGNALINDKEFWNDLVEAEAIYPEMPFEFKAEKDNVKDDIKKYQQGQDIYVRGTMDLVLELKDRFIIWDYKSNVITPSEDVDAFTQRLYREYEPQLRIYKEALKNIIANDETKCNKPIETKLYHRFRNED